MNNNDILRRLRYAFNYSDAKMVKIIGHVGEKVDSAQVAKWLKRDEHDEFQLLSDEGLCRFLDGLIIEKRGARPDAPLPTPVKFLSINEILKKLRIALALRDEGMLEVFGKVDFKVSKAELGSFFRKENQRNFAKCPEQVLRKFLQGLSKAA